MSDKNEEWKDKLTPEQFKVLRQCGTEPAFTGAYWDHKADGMYRCAGCETELFDSKTKFDSGSGWPSFWEPLVGEKITQVDDHSFGRHRIEVRCAKCDGHLGHVFPDGPQPTGERFCINSAALDFVDRDGDK